MRNMIRFMADKKRGMIYAFIAIILLLALRLPSFTRSVIDWDESIYLLVGDNILQGGIPYREIWDNKGPLLYFIFAFIIKITARSIIGLRLFTTIWAAITAFLIFLIGKKLYNKISGIFASLFFIILISDLELGGLASNAELFFILPVLIGIYIVLFREINLKNLFFSGILLGLAFNIKTISIFDFAALLFFILLTKIKKKINFLKTVNHLLLFFLGFLVPFFIFVVYFYRKEFLNGFLSTIFNNTALFISYSIDPLSIIKNFIVFIYHIFIETWAVSILAIIAISGYISGLYEKNEKVKFLLIWLFFLLSGIIIHHRFWSHMFIQAIPAVCLLAGLSLAKIFTLKINKLTFVFLILCLSLGMIYPVRYNIKDGLRMVLYQKNIKLNDTAAKISEYLRMRLKPSEYIFVANFCPVTYFLTDAKIPSRYINFLVLQQPLYEKMLNFDAVEEVKKILDKKPSYIIVAPSEKIISDKVDIYLKKYLRENYLLEKTIDGVDIFKGRYSEFR